MMKDDGVEKFSFAELFPDSGHCDREGTLLLYFEERLSTDEQESFTKHLVSCSACAGKLAFLEREGHRVQDAIVDPKEAARIFERNRLRLRAELDTKYPSAQAIPAPLISFKRSQFMLGVMMVLLAILVYPAYRGIVLDREVDRLQGELTAERSKSSPAVIDTGESEIRALKEENRRLVAPSVSKSVVYSARAERGGEIEIIEVDFTRLDSLDLVFSLPPSEPGPYTLQIISQNKTVWQRTIPVDSPNPLISVHLLEAQFPAGDYQLQISRGPDASGLLLAAYKLRLIKPTSPNNR